MAQNGKDNDALIWFEEYDGPKSLGWQDGKFVCSVGFNLRTGSCVQGHEVTETAETTVSAIMAVKRQYDRFIDGISPS